MYVGPHVLDLTVHLAHVIIVSPQSQLDLDLDLDCLSLRGPDLGLGLDNNNKKQNYYYYWWGTPAVTPLWGPSLLWTWSTNTGHICSLVRCMMFFSIAFFPSSSKTILLKRMDKVLSNPVIKFCQKLFFYQNSSNRSSMSLCPLSCIEVRVYNRKPKDNVIVTKQSLRFSRIWGIPVFTTSGMNSAFRDKSSEYRYIYFLQLLKSRQKLL